VYLQICHNFLFQPFWEGKSNITPEIYHSKIVFNISWHCLDGFPYKLQPHILTFVCNSRNAVQTFLFQTILEHLSSNNPFQLEIHCVYFICVTQLLSCIFQFLVHVFINQKMEWKIRISARIFGIPVFWNSGSQFGARKWNSFCWKIRKKSICPLWSGSQATFLCKSRA